jgi:hypothetical protein
LYRENVLYFNPKKIQKVFSEDDVKKLRNILDSNSEKNNWIDRKNNRRILKFSELETYFSKKIEPLAQEIFKDPSLKTTYSVYLDYNKPTSNLPPHRDNNACTYTIDYCVSAKTPWGVVVEGQEYIFEENEALAFMGGFDSHWRNEMPDPQNNRVEVIMFHFSPADHWYFTEGDDYFYYLMDNNLLPSGDSYYLSPQKTQKMI